MLELMLKAFIQRREREAEAARQGQRGGGISLEQMLTSMGVKRGGRRR